MDVINEIEKFTSTGCTWITDELLKKRIGSLNSLPALINSNQIIFHKAVDKNDINAFTIPQLHYAENKIAENVIKLVTAKRITYPTFYINNQIKIAEKKFGFSLDIEQSLAVHVAVQNPFCIITGGPGTGKTCVLNVVREVLLSINPNFKILFTAPTGKAARRITESTGCKAYTLHKKLGITKKNLVPKKLNDLNALIVDECSMLDTLIANSLFEAVTDGLKIILVGDVDQLPSVGAGAILNDLINSNVVPVVKLTKTFRQAGESYILLNALKIKNGNTQLEENDDFKIVKTKGFLETAEKMEQLFLEQIAIYGLKNVVCLTPYRVNGEAGSIEMNKRLQKRINPAKKGTPDISYYNTVFRLNDIVMQLENRTECANGDVGKITAIDSEKKTITVEFIDGIVIYKKYQLKQLTLAYAMTIHKSQGSEYKSVVTCLCKEHVGMLKRNLLYTAITRAKLMCTLIGDEEAIEEAINCEESGTRITMLTEKIIACMKRYRFFA